MTLRDKQAELAILALRIEAFTAQYNKLKGEVIAEMNAPKGTQCQTESGKKESPPSK